MTLEANNYGTPGLLISESGTKGNGPFRWRQYLTFTEFGSHFYFDERNGEPIPR